MTLALGVWVVIAILSTAALIACVLGLFANLRAMLRTLRRFKDEIDPVAREISEQGARASTRSSGMRLPGSDRS